MYAYERTERLRFYVGIAAIFSDLNVAKIQSVVWIVRVISIGADDKDKIVGRHSYDGTG